MKGKVIRMVVMVLLLVLMGIGQEYASGAKKDAMLTAGFREDPGILDPASIMPSNPTWFIWYQTYERLVVADRKDPNKVKPVLATDWTSLEGGKIWEFKLRKGVKFHDGTPFNAEAVKYSFGRLIGIGLGPSKWFADVIEEVQVVDDYTVKFILKRPYFLFPGLLSVMDGPYIVSPTAFKAHATTDDPWAKEWTKSNIVGTGPYIFDEWVHGQYITVVKNKDYWGGWEGKHFDKIMFKIVREPGSRKMGLITGALDYAEDIVYTDIADIEKDPNVNVHVYPTTQLWMVHMNNQRPPLNDVRLRKALSWAFPYKDAIDFIFLGYAKQAQGAMGRDMAYHEDNLPMFSTDLGKAKELLEKAKYKPGEITLDLYWITGLDFQRRIAEAFQSNLGQIGIKVEIKSAPWPTIVELNGRPPAERPYMTIRYNAPDYADPFSQTLRPIYACGDPWNWEAYCNPRYDELLSRGELSADPVEIERIAKELQWMVFNEAANIFLAEGTGVAATRKDIKGFYTIPYYPGITYVYDMYRE